jgi:predicted GNAT family acetyltransferase
MSKRAASAAPTRATKRRAAAKAQVELREAESRFVLGSARLEYALHAGVLEITHTYTPPRLRGRGLAAQLCVSAFAWARARGLAVRSTCSYVRDTFLPRNPQLAEVAETQAPASAAAAPLSAATPPNAAQAQTREAEGMKYISTE